MKFHIYSNQAVTRLYLGISQGDIDNVYRLVNYMGYVDRRYNEGLSMVYKHICKSFLNIKYYQN